MLERFHWFIGVVFFVVASGSQEGWKTPIPSDAERTKAKKLIREIFTEESPKRDLRNKIKLAQKLTVPAAHSKDDPATRLVLPYEAQDLMTQAGDHQSTLRAIHGAISSLASAYERRSGMRSRRQVRGNGEVKP